MTKPSRKGTDSQAKDNAGDKASLPVCGLVMPVTAAAPYEPAHWQEVRIVLDRAIEAAGFRPQPVWEGGDADIIQDRIVTNLFQNPMIVCDVSGLNPNVMVELGMRLSFGKPLVIVTDDVKKLPFDTSIIEHVPYPADLHIIRTENFVEALRGKLEQVAKRAEEGNYKPYVKNFGPVELGALGSEERSFDQYVVQRIDSLASEVRALRHSSTPLYEVDAPFPRRAAGNAGSVSLLNTWSPPADRVDLRFPGPLVDVSQVKGIMSSLRGVRSIIDRGNGSYTLELDWPKTASRLAEIHDAFEREGVRVDVG